ncbi:hypothetical protein D9756_004916 [Leucocoprinus leucothites]|uniref:Uncharacterized protein n=1 Tax=Leucocoprinus leucothites TaxID=201217 RepID=A0A8H5G8V6_9AGAR|nr:hypothetical protein D9756_004916 [Leucoagaricus leucothites]
MRIQALGGSTDGQTQEIGRAENGKKDLLSPGLLKIPWTIENKYYSADVHFAVHPMRGLAPYLLQNIPAIIFVWASNEAYKHHVERISRDLGGHEPEVSLAVRVKASPDSVPEESAGEDEIAESNASIDEFVSRFGFEYVDATLDITDRREERKYGEEDELDGIPNLPRVLDALSTIMWPSMKGRDKGVKHGKGLHSATLACLNGEPEMEWIIAYHWLTTYQHKSAGNKVKWTSLPSGWRMMYWTVIARIRGEWQCVRTQWLLLRQRTNFPPLLLGKNIKSRQDHQSRLTLPSLMMILPCSCRLLLRSPANNPDDQRQSRTD